MQCIISRAGQAPVCQARLSSNVRPHDHKTMSSQVFLARPPTPEEIDSLATISAVSFILGALAFVCVLAAASVVAVKTKLPGRHSVLASLTLLPAWWGFEKYMGGSLEMTYGPSALLVTFVVYAAVAVVFAFGYLRMCLAFVRERAIKPA